MMTQDEKEDIKLNYIKFNVRLFEHVLKNVKFPSEESEKKFIVSMLKEIVFAFAGKSTHMDLLKIQKYSENKHKRAKEIDHE